MCRTNIIVSKYMQIILLILSTGIYILIHSFILAISIAPLQVHYYSEAIPTTARILYRSFTPKRTGNCSLSKGLALGPHVATRAGVEPWTLRLRVIDLTNAPPRPTIPQYIDRKSVV